MTPAPVRTSRPSWLEIAALSLLLLVAAAFRAYHLGLPTLTGDEWFMLRNHDEGPAWIVRQARVFASDSPSVALWAGRYSAIV